MPREISDEEYTHLQGRKQVADFVESIWNDPTLSKEARALVKKKYPNLSIPDYDIETKVMSRLDQEKKAREDAEAATKRKKQDDDIATTRKRVQEEFGLNDDGMKKLEDMMVERNIGDYEVAASYMASREPKTTEATYESHFWNHPKKEGFKEIAADPEGWAHKQILQAVAADERRAKQRY